MLKIITWIIFQSTFKSSVFKSVIRLVRVCVPAKSQLWQLVFSPWIRSFLLIFRRKTESFPGRSKQLIPTAPSVSSIQGPYAFSDITKLPHAALDYRTQAEIMTKYSCPYSHDAQYPDYENVTCSEKETGFVTNDIYETARTQSRRCRSQDGWVENEIYG